VSSTRLIAEAVLSCRRRREQETSEAASTTRAIPHTEVFSRNKLYKTETTFWKKCQWKAKSPHCCCVFSCDLHVSAYMISLGNTEKSVGKTTCRHFSVPLLQDEGIRKEVRENDMYRRNQSFCVYISTK